MQKEEAQELTEKLDQEWKSIQALMVKKTAKAEHTDKPEEKPKVRKRRPVAKLLPAYDDARHSSLLPGCSSMNTT